MADDALREFDRALGLPIFLCQRCLSYLALMTQGQLIINVQRRAIFFPPIRCINLLVDPPENHFTQNSTTWLARVFCRGCYTIMGYKIVGETNPDRPDQEGTVVMDMDVLLLWDGHDLFSLMVRVLMWPPPPPPPLLLLPAPPPMLPSPADPAPSAPQPPSSTSPTNDHQRSSSLVPLPMLQLLLPSPPILLLPAPALHPPSSTGAANAHLMFSSLVPLSMPPQPYQPPLVVLLPPPIPLVPAPAPQPPSPTANLATDPNATTALPATTSSTIATTPPIPLVPAPQPPSPTANPGHRPHKHNRWSE